MGIRVDGCRGKAATGVCKYVRESEIEEKKDKTPRRKVLGFHGRNKNWVKNNIFFRKTQKRKKSRAREQVQFYVRILLKK